MNGSARVLVAIAAVVTIVTVGALGLDRFLPSSSGTGGIATPSVTPAPTASATFALPVGTFAGNVPSNGTGAAVGPWQLAFIASQGFYRKPDGEGFSQDVHADSPDELTFGPDDCKTGTGEGRYRWSLSGTTLTLTKLSDPSACRVLVLTSGPWERVSN